MLPPRGGGIFKYGGAEIAIFEEISTSEISAIHTGNLYRGNDSVHNTKADAC